MLEKKILFLWKCIRFYEIITVPLCFTFYCRWSLVRVALGVVLGSTAVLNSDGGRALIPNNLG